MLVDWGWGPIQFNPIQLGWGVVLTLTIFSIFRLIPTFVIWRKSLRNILGLGSNWTHVLRIGLCFRVKLHFSHGASISFLFFSLKVHQFRRFYRLQFNNSPKSVTPPYFKRGRGWGWVGEGRRQEGEGYSEHMQDPLLLSSYFFLDYSTEEK